ncbi:RICIN domain-containing protein [Streptomyces coeruleoprunus]|uniref:RICIN domain-containing protein n=1 Tax=Streptomyces coeruleoprunus TaxID=285563 RepID=UPI0035E8C00E
MLPGIQAPAGPPDNRRIVARAFRSLPADAQVLLWHREVEAEGLSIPAALLAIDPRGAAERLAEARELFRERCASVHQELAPDRECRHFGRLLDISLRRTGPLIPDIQRHLAQCPYCRAAADQLRQSDGRLPLLLAEAVLGGGAARYLESRPARARAYGRQGGGPGEGRRAGRHSRAVRRRAEASPGGAALLRAGAAVRAGAASLRRRAPLRNGAVLAGVGAAVGGVLVVALVAGLWPEGGTGDGAAGTGGAAGAAVTGGAPGPGAMSPSGAGTTGPGTGAGHGEGGVQGAGPGVPQPPAPAGHPAGPLHTRLRNAEAGLCLDIRDGRALTGAELTLAVCSGERTQQWTYDPDGLLRSGAAPQLCPDAQRLDGTVVLAVCGAGGRYDLTVQGTVIPRWNEDLALAPVSPTAGTGLVVKVRDDSHAQRWLTDAPTAAPRAQWPAGTASAPAREVGSGPSARTGQPGTGPAPAGTGSTRPPASVYRADGGAPEAARREAVDTEAAGLPRLAAAPAPGPLTLTPVRAESRRHAGASCGSSAGKGPGASARCGPPPPGDR